MLPLWHCGVVPNDSRTTRCQIAPDVDQVVGNHPQPHPALHALQSVVTATGQPVAALDDTDSSFTPRPPLLCSLEPTLLLQSTSFLTARVPVRKRNVLHPQRMGSFFIRLGVETCIG